MAFYRQWTNNNGLVTGCAAWLVRGLLGDIKQRLKKVELKNTDLTSKVTKGGGAGS